MATVATGRAGRKLLESVRGLPQKLHSADLSVGEPSKPMLGLPLRRVIPQDVHSVLDYTGGLLGALNSLVAESTKAKVANAALAGTVAGLSLLTDYRISVAKVVPVEVHEVGDYVYGAANILAPFVLGYYRKEPMVAALQVASGLTTIVASLFTDYRAVKGVKWAKEVSPDRRRS
ncbi:MAG TPA: hypothetical protein VEY30_10745 [Myxococcaceae bacterium]|nr:hypothetical protein [Myxococcaceae bacterium]